MKALILAAGFGTRLLPLTQRIPKPLFPIAGRPLLDIIIHSLQQAGCEAIIINTHHLHQQIESFVASRNYSIPVYTRHEPFILGTGGAIKNVADFWDQQPFMVVNSDILTDMDLKAVYDFHLQHRYPVSLVLYNDPEFNSVVVGPDGFITDIRNAVAASESTGTHPGKNQVLTFTGIQVLSPEILDEIPENTFSSSIDLYRHFIPEQKVKAYIASNHFWTDIGTPKRYTDAVYRILTPEAFSQAFNQDRSEPILRTALHGDGSDRKWYRLTRGNRSVIMVDHGIKSSDETDQTDAFVSIGRHLYAHGIQVPEIYRYDTFCGLVFMEDLGDLNLQSVITTAQDQQQIILWYQKVIDLLVNMSVSGAQNFDTTWTYQTSSYDRDVILDKECRYFVEAFLNGYLNIPADFEDLKNDFSCLADQALKYAINGFMHRDLQSRNIMVKKNQFYFIDFQGGRMGPLQYDLASLLIDPYVSLPYPVQEQLCRYGRQALSAVCPVDPDVFHTGYTYCAVTRNLQILGAFGFLSRVKGKTYFEKYIPKALETLKTNLAVLNLTALDKLKSLVEKL